MSFILEAKNLRKTFRYQKRNTGLNWFKSDYITIEAVKSLDLAILLGERLAFIGPNGAGKSTTIKMLSGILTSTSGTLSVCGLDPVHQRQQLSYQIGCVFGQRSQLLPNLPLYDSLQLFGRMYDLPAEQITQRIAYLTDIFTLDAFMDQPVRQLSLGQRMRGEIAASLMHKPKIIFLDEPTIGLDVIAKRELRRTLIELNEQENTTIFLTSHDTGDIESLCQRIIVIDHGQIIIDTPTRELQKTYLNKKYFKIDYTDAIHADRVTQMGFHVQGNSVKGAIDTSTQSLNHTLKQLLDLAPVEDIHLYDEELEDIIIDIYHNGKRS